MSKRLLPNDEIIIDLYVNKNKSCKEICRMFGVSPNTSNSVATILKRHNIEIRQDKGKNHHNWKGGRIIKGDGYIGIWSPNHIRADNQGYVYEHTLVYEKEKGILPNKENVIHHIDLDKTNNDINNLYLCNYKDHLSLHRSIEKLIKPLLEQEIICFNNGEYKLKDIYKECD